LIEIVRILAQAVWRALSQVARERLPAHTGYFLVCQAGGLGDSKAEGAPHRPFG